ncbi:unnamed protein product, partial [Ambrosiozyma monospora]
MLGTKRYITTSTKFPLKDFGSHLTRHEISSAEKRDLVLTILNSTATKREARNYLAKYPLLEENDIYKNKKRLNDGFSRGLIIDQNNNIVEKRHKKKKYEDLMEKVLTKDAPEIDTDLKALATSPDLPATQSEAHLTDTIRMVVLKIRDLRSLTVDQVEGIGKTLNKMVKLGTSPVIVLDEDYQSGKAFYNTVIVERNIMEESNNLIRVLENANLDLKLRAVRGLYEVEEDGNLTLTMPELITVPLFQGIIPVVFPVGTGIADSREKIIDSFNAIKTLVTSLQQTNEKSKKSKKDTDILTIEKILYLDKLGGIPSLERFQSSHVFINLLQEYQDIIAELHIGHIPPFERDVHEKNLNDMSRLLELLPNATGIITTPEIATLQKVKQFANPIIHNILTDRPSISSSLPVNLKITPQLNTTIVKRGLPVKLLLSDFPEQGLDLRKMHEEGEIDLNKLKFLIDDSFKRNLNMDHYLDRINGK